MASWICQGWLPGFLAGSWCHLLWGGDWGQIGFKEKTKCLIFDLLSLIYHIGLTNWLNKSVVSYYKFPMNKRMKLVSFRYWGVSNNQTSLHGSNHKSLFLTHVWNVCGAAGPGWAWILSAGWALACSWCAYCRLQAASAAAIEEPLHIVVTNAHEITPHSCQNIHGLISLIWNGHIDALAHIPSFKASPWPWDLALSPAHFSNWHWRDKWQRLLLHKASGRSK